jgi:hypothetical protein
VKMEINEFETCREGKFVGGRMDRGKGEEEMVRRLRRGKKGKKEKEKNQEVENLSFQTGLFFSRATESFELVRNT